MVKVSCTTMQGCQSAITRIRKAMRSGQVKQGKSKKVFKEHPYREFVKENYTIVRDDLLQNNPQMASLTKKELFSAVSKELASVYKALDLL